jgi:hypothetical protein
MTDTTGASKMERAEVIKNMKAWCLENYENGADTMVECWDDGDYESLIVGCDGDLDKAWETLDHIRSVFADRQADARYYRENW